jgi:hypothetical protein
MSARRLIAISGAAGSGKSTAAAVLETQRNYAVVSLADPIKRACADWFGWDRDTLWGESSKRNAPDPRYPHILDGGPFGESVARCLTPRRALQFLGTEVGRELYREVWVEYALRVAERLLSDKRADGWDRRDVYSPERGAYETFTHRKLGGIVIPDIRFESELEALQAAGALTIRIVRPGAGLTGDAALHASETEVASLPDEAFDVVIRNDRTLADLELAVLAAVDKNQ